MFGSLIESLAKAAVGVVTLPVDLVADTITLGGALTDRPVPYTAEKASDIMSNLKEATTND